MKQTAVGFRQGGASRYFPVHASIVIIETMFSFWMENPKQQLHDHQPCSNNPSIHSVFWNLEDDMIIGLFSYKPIVLPSCLPLTHKICLEISPYTTYISRAQGLGFDKKIGTDFQANFSIDDWALRKKKSISGKHPSSAGISGFFQRNMSDIIKHFF